MVVRATLGLYATNFCLPSSLITELTENILRKVEYITMA